MSVPFNKKYIQNTKAKTESDRIEKWSAIIRNNIY